MMITAANDLPADAEATAPQQYRSFFYLFGSIAGFFPSLRRLRLSGRRPSFADTVLGFGHIGAGDPASLAAFTINIAESNFWHTQGCGRRVVVALQHHLETER